jgi:Fe-S-cluster containining protein
MAKCKSNATGEAVTPLCAKCAALCCRQIALPLDNPESANDYDNIRWYLMHENVHVFVEEGQWYVAFATRCKHLQDDNLCGIYETRPRICRDYTTDGCEWHGGEYDYEHLFTSAEQLRKHADEVLGRPLVKGERKRQRAKANNGKLKLPLA